LQTNKRTYRSRFGGLWVDDIDRGYVERKIAGISNPILRRQVADFERDGFVVLNQAVPHAAIDSYLAQYRMATSAEAGSKLIMSVPYVANTEPFSAEKAKIPGSKILDTSMLFGAGDELSFSGGVSRFLGAIFEGPSLAFQSLHFEVGSVQTIHQDTAYVVVAGEPMHLVASWIALEDIIPGTGELVYFVGGHRMQEYVYADGTSKHFNAERDGPAPHDRHLKYLYEEAKRCGYYKSSFLPKKGDVLFWHADLPHGGGEITKPGATRRSLVTHYCPYSQTPFYFKFLSEQSQKKVKAPSGNYFCSMYYPPQQFSASAGNPADHGGGTKRR
jgi:phytanoyl-CoA hydroxylase